jgi:hypothetical protein
MRINRFLVAISAACAMASTPSVALAQLWTNWDGAISCNQQVVGSLAAATVTYSGGFNAVQRDTGSDVCNSIGQLGGQGDNYWQRGGFNSAAYSLIPSNLSFIQFSAAATGTISFSQAVVDPWIALISVGNPDGETTITFGSPFTIVSRNNTLESLAYWDATPDVDSYVAGNSIVSSEFSGLIQFKGTFTELSVGTVGEYWHGFTVGTPSLAVPEPSSFALVAAGLASLVVISRRRQNR